MALSKADHISVRNSDAKPMHDKHRVAHLQSICIFYHSCECINAGVLVLEGGSKSHNVTKMKMLFNSNQKKNVLLEITDRFPRQESTNHS